MQAVEAAEPLGRRLVGTLGRARPYRASRRRSRRDADLGVDVDESDVLAAVLRARAGDAEAFGALFEAFRPDVARLCRRLLGTGEDARDATSEAFLRARRGLDAYDPARPFRRWLLAIASNHAVDCLRRRAASKRLFEPDPLDAERVQAPGPSPLGGELGAELRRQVLAAIDELPDRYRAAVVLRYYIELEYREIAEALDVTVNQVGTLLLRGRRLLRERLQSRLGEATAE